MAAFPGIIALGMMLIITNDGIDLAAGSLVGFSSVVCAMLGHPGQTLLIVPIFMAPLTGLLSGLITGFLVTVPKIPPFIATLGMLSVTKGTAMIISHGLPIGDIRPEIVYLGSARIAGFLPVPILIFIILIIVTHVLMSRTKLGKKIYAIGGNEQAARVCGVNVRNVRILVYMIEGFLVAVSGILLTGRIASGAAINGTGYELDAIAACVIGGVSMSGGSGRVMGVIFGVFIMGVLQNGLDLMGVDPNLQQVFKGAIIIAAVVVDNVRKTSKD